MAKPSAKDDAVREFLKDGRLATTADFKGLGLTRVAVFRMLERGLIEREGYGVYSLAGGMGEPLAVIAKRHGGTRAEPHGVLCLKVAAHLHGLSDLDLWNIERLEVSLPRTSNTRVADQKAVRIVQLTNRHENQDLEWHEFCGHGIHVTTPARTVCDLYAPWAGPLGEGMQHEALGRLANVDFKQATLAAERASQLGWGDIITLHLQGIAQFRRYHDIEAEVETGGLSL